MIRFLYNWSSALFVILVAPFILIGFLVGGVMIAFRLGLSLFNQFENYGERRGWESKKENDAFAKRHKL